MTAHSHGHGSCPDAHGEHSHGHSHTRGKSQAALKRALAVTLFFLIIEAVGGWLSNSLALLADAGHMFTDASSLGLALLAGWVARLSASRRRSYGWHRMEILAAFLNGLLLVLVSIIISKEAIERFRAPAVVDAKLMMVIAFIGLVANITSGWILFKASHESLNVRGAFLHVVADTMGSVGALTASILIALFGWNIADPIIGIAISILVLFSSYTLIRESISILLESTPRSIDLEAIEREVLNVPGVGSIHDMHVWTVTSGYLVLTAHVVLREGAIGDEVLKHLNDVISEKWGITHTTIQVEAQSREHLEIRPLR